MSSRSLGVHERIHQVTKVKNLLEQLPIYQEPKEIFWKP